MKLNPRKINSIIISRSRTSHSLQFLTSIVLHTEVSSSFKLLEVTLDNKLTFKKYFRNIASFIAQKTGLIRKCYKTNGNNDAVLKSFFP